MANESIHLIIPLMLLLLLSRRTKTIFILLPFAVLPDLDYFFYHRALLHNVFLPLIPALLILLSKTKLGNFRFLGWVRDHQHALLIICFYLSSHIFLDYFDEGIVFFFPISNALYFTRIDLGAEVVHEQRIIVNETGKWVINVTRTRPLVEMGSGAYDYSRVMFRERLLFSSSVEFAVFSMCLAIICAELLRRKFKKL